MPVSIIPSKGIPNRQFTRSVVEITEIIQYVYHNNQALCTA